MPITADICRYLEVDLTPEIARGIDAIFYESSNTKSFETERSRLAFRDRWLGRYLRNDPEFAYLAMRPDGAVAGYLVGAVDDPAAHSRFADIGFYADFSLRTKQFPAHLHMNVAAQFRDNGIGRRLVERFATDAKAHGAAGVHVVTSAGAQNVRFYNQNGFEEAARTGPAGELVFLARVL
ncbi:GNAT family N-acetyltransferase [Hyphomicrobium sp.]|uniref:GNAT family N-acetyltransferase n=1 Tax=Hyphomicrobium sp. TaxID=82 RepID=UPI002D77E5F4|nr:GNAT family N-acetyltransferase [Hyphomicrobium sp.]HET6389993.1 GNAT family N-acetyltransferase [Hyphomicrobium sp.]